MQNPSRIFCTTDCKLPIENWDAFPCGFWWFSSKIRALFKKTNNVKKNKHIIKNTLMIYTTWKSFQNFLSTLFLRFFFVKKIPQLSSVFSLSFFTYAFLAFFQPYREAYGKNEKWENAIPRACLALTDHIKFHGISDRSNFCGGIQGEKNKKGPLSPPI